MVKSTIVCVVSAVLLTGCLSEDGSGINRPDDQAFDGDNGVGGDGPTEITHFFTDITLLAQSVDESRATANGIADQDDDPKDIEIFLPLDDNVLISDPGSRGGEVFNEIELVLSANEESISEIIAVTINPGQQPAQ